MSSFWQHTIGAAMYFAFLACLPHVECHGWTSLRNENGETIESRNSVAWKNGAGYPNPQGMSQTNSASRPLYCGGKGQSGFSKPEHDLISAQDALKKARDSGFATRLAKGSKFTLQNFITANHGGVAALYYSCPGPSVDTPEEYSALEWKLLTPIKNSYPESKRNGVAFSDKMPDWYGFAGSICNFGAGYTGGVIQECDDCQLRYGGPKTTASWNAEKPPTGAPLGTGQMATIVDVEYQLPADFECPNAVFSWLWHTPHLCVPKEVADKQAENDFWKFCNRNLQGFYGACNTEWQDEIFVNCIDAEVTGNGSHSAAPGASRPSPTPSPTADAIHSPGMCAPVGDCGSHSWCNQDEYRSWCASKSHACPEPFCKVTDFSSPTVAPTDVPVPTLAPVTSPFGTCVATLDSYYSDPAVWTPYCQQMDAVGACPSPMCKMRTSMLATTRKHTFLGTSLMQMRSGVRSLEDVDSIEKHEL